MAGGRAGEKRRERNTFHVESIVRLKNMQKLFKFIFKHFSNSLSNTCKEKLGLRAQRKIGPSLSYHRPLLCFLSVFPPREYAACISFVMHMRCLMKCLSV